MCFWFPAPVTAVPRMAQLDMGYVHTLTIGTTLLNFSRKGFMECWVHGSGIANTRWQTVRVSQQLVDLGMMHESR